MKKITFQNIKNSQVSNVHLNKIRGGISGSATRCKKDENSDSNGDGIADDCTYHNDDTGIVLPPPVLA